MAKATAIKDPMTKSQLLTTLAEETGLTKRECTAVLDELSNVVARHLKRRGAGTFTLPGMFKIKTTKKPATKARKGINPFTGEETMLITRLGARRDARTHYGPDRCRLVEKTCWNPREFSAFSMYGCLFNWSKYMVVNRMPSARSALRNFSLGASLKCSF